jgi:aldehyde:ferredoxin oxidoreductase
MECHEKGILPPAQTNGMDLRFGNDAAMVELLKKIAAREGIGNILADGIVSASHHFDVEDIAVHVKGLEPAGYDPRKLKGMGLTFGTSPRGACHLRTTFYKPELAGWIPPEQIENKANMLIDYEDRLNIFDTLILCRFYRDLYSWEELEKSINLVAGIKVSKEMLRKIASTITDMTRKFNIQEGFQPVDDRLPERLHKEALPEGGILSKDEMEYLLQDYYRIRGWDNNGFPSG